MRISTFVAPVGANPQDWLDWIADVAAVLGIPDPPAYIPPTGPDGQPLPVDPNRIERMMIIYLDQIPAPLLPPDVDPTDRSLRLDLIIVKATKSVATGETGPLGQPLYDSIDNGWQSDLVASVGPGLPWDVDSLFDLVTASIVATGETMEHETETRGTLTLPAIPAQWAAVNTLHSDRVYAVWASPNTIVDPGTLPQPLSPG